MKLLENIDRDIRGDLQGVESHAILECNDDALWYLKAREARKRG